MSLSHHAPRPLQCRLVWEFFLEGETVGKSRPRVHTTNILKNKNSDRFNIDNPSIGMLLRIKRQQNVSEITSLTDTPAAERIVRALNLVQNIYMCLVYASCTFWCYYHSQLAKKELQIFVIHVLKWLRKKKILKQCVSAICPATGVLVPAAYSTKNK